MKDRLYAIRMLPLREQIRDTYRVLFFPALLVVLALASLLFERWLAAGVIRGMLIGGCAGTLPSLLLGTPARMLISSGDRVTIETWLASHGHLRDTRGWVPKMPRALYFDSQIIRCDDNSVIGPVVILHKLRRILRANTRIPA